MEPGTVTGLAEQRRKEGILLPVATGVTDDRLDATTAERYEVSKKRGTVQLEPFEMTFVSHGIALTSRAPAALLWP